MRRRLPSEPKQLVADLASWIEWRYADAKEHLVLTSAPTTLPSALEKWMPNAVWRLAWLGDGAAILFGLAPTSGGKYVVVQHDAVNARREGTFEKLPHGAWCGVDGDSLGPEAKKIAYRMIVGLGDHRRSMPRHSPPRIDARTALESHASRKAR